MPFHTWNWELFFLQFSFMRFCDAFWPVKNLNSFKFYILAFVFVHTVKEILWAWAMRSLETEDVLSRTIYCSLRHQGEPKMTAVQQVKCHDWLFRKLTIRSSLSYEICHITTGQLNAKISISIYEYNPREPALFPDSGVCRGLGPCRLEHRGLKSHICCNTTNMH